MKNIGKFIVLIFVVFCAIACDKDEDDSPDFIYVKFLGAEGSLIKNPNLSVKIYGYDYWIADVSASLITEQQFESSEVPFTLKIHVPNFPWEKIDPLMNTEDAVYYMIVEWDSDGNGIERCSGDVIEDYDRNGGTAKLDLSTSAEQIIYLRSISETSSCN